MEREDGMEAQDVVLSSKVQDAEAELIRDAKACLPEAWKEIYQRHYKQMYVYIFCRLNDRASAEDLASQVFLEAFRGIRSFTYRGVPFSAWLYKIAHNLCIDFVRRRRVVLQPLNEADESNAGSHDDWEAINNHAALAAALPRLTLEQQQVVVLRFVKDMPLANVAAALGKSEEAVKALQHRALASLRRYLRGEGGS